MIIDKLENFPKYVDLNTKFKDVVSYIENTELASLEDGRVVIDGDNLYLNIETIKSRTIEEAKLESHKKKIDIQIPLTCNEIFGVLDIDKTKPTKYDVANDISFYGEKPSSYYTVEKGSFIIFFPYELHAPCISSTEFIHKIVFKVKA